MLHSGQVHRNGGICSFVSVVPLLPRAWIRQGSTREVGLVGVSTFVHVHSHSAVSRAV